MKSKDTLPGFPHRPEHESVGDALTRMRALRDFEEDDGFDHDVDAIADDVSERVGITRSLRDGDAMLLLLDGEFDAFLGSIHRYKNLSSDAARILLASNNGLAILEHIDCFKHSEHSKLARLLLRAGFGEAVLESLNDFQGLDPNTTVELFFSEGRADVLLEGMEKVNGLDRRLVVERLFDKDLLSLLFEYIDQFKGYMMLIAQKFIALDEIEACAEYLVFNPTEQLWYVDQTLDKGMVEAVLDGYHDSVYSDENYFKIAMKMVEKGHLVDIVEFITSDTTKEFFQESDKFKLAMAVIKVGGAEFVARNLDCFDDVGIEFLIPAMMESGVDKQKILVALEESSFEKLVHLRKSTKQEKITEKLYGRWRVMVAKSLASSGVDQSEIEKYLSPIKSAAN